jgi:hypothetical protein
VINLAGMSTVLLLHNPNATKMMVNDENIEKKKQ